MTLQLTGNIIERLYGKMWSQQAELSLHDYSQPLLDNKCTDTPFSLSLPQSFAFDSGFCRVNFHFFEPNFCFKS